MIIEQIKDKIKKVHNEYILRVSGDELQMNSKRVCDHWLYIQPSNRKLLIRELVSDGLKLTEHTIKGIKYVRIHIPSDSLWSPRIQSVVYQTNILMAMLEVLNEKYGKTINIMYFSEWVNYD